MNPICQVKSWVRAKLSTHCSTAAPMGVRAERAEWLMAAFREAVDDCSLQDGTVHAPWLVTVHDTLTAPDSSSSKV